MFWKPLHTTQSNDTQSTESQESVESEKNDENNAELQKRLQALQKRYHVLLSQHRRKERERQNTRTRIKRIKRLHQYNAAKDAAHELFGKIGKKIEILVSSFLISFVCSISFLFSSYTAELESVRVIDLYERFGIEDV